MSSNNAPGYNIISISRELSVNRLNSLTTRFLWDQGFGGKYKVYRSSTKMTLSMRKNHLTITVKYKFRTIEGATEYIE